MPMDALLHENLVLAQVTRHNEQAARTNVIGDNLVQGLGVVNTSLIQQHGSTADDAATMAALRTSIHVPQKDGG